MKMLKNNLMIFIYPYSKLKTMILTATAIVVSKVIVINLMFEANKKSSLKKIHLHLLMV